MDLSEVTAYLQTSQEEDRAMQITPDELRDALASGLPHPVRLLDIRTREEYEAVHLAGAELFSQDLMTTILMQWPRDLGLIALIDHQGARSLDAAAYLRRAWFHQRQGPARRHRRLEPTDRTHLSLATRWSNISTARESACAPPGSPPL